MNGKFDETEMVNKEQLAAIETLMRSAMYVVNEGPAGKMITAEVAEVIRAGNAAVVCEVLLPAGPISILLQASDGERREMVRIPLECRGTH